MNHKQKLTRILGLTGWGQERLAYLMMINRGTMSRWLKGKPVRQEANITKIDWLYTELVEPFVCEIEERSDKVEKQLLKSRIKSLADDNVCRD